MFMFAIKVGSVLSISSTSWGALFVDGSPPAGLVNAPEWLGAILADGLGAGLQTVATFIPVIGCLFCSWVVLERVRLSGPCRLRGGMPWMRRLGLPGKSHADGFGCTVPR